jgi:exosortase
VTSVASNSALGVGPDQAPRDGDAPSLVARLVWSPDPQRRYMGAALGAVFALAYALMFFRWFDTQLGPGGEILGVDFGRGSFSFNSFEDWGHAYVIPLISAAYIWTNRKNLDASLARTFWPGIAPMITGILLYAYFSVAYSNHMFQGAAMILTLLGAALLLLGPHLLRPLMFPIGFLALGVTISESIMLTITFPLRELAAVGGHELLSVVGVENTLTGNVINVVTSAGEVHPLDVAEACSGMRMVVAFVALSVAVAFFSCPQWWQRVAVMLVGVPVAIFMNVIRVAVLALLTLIDPDLAVGGAHSLIGTLLLIPAFGLFMLFVWVFRKATPESSAGVGGPGVGSAESVTGGVS